MAKKLSKAKRLVDEAMLAKVRVGGRPPKVMARNRDRPALIKNLS
jgi:hypothetical protein